MTKEEARTAPLEDVFAECIVTVNYGGGTDSTGMVVELVRRGLTRMVLYTADTGSEKPGFYAYLPRFSHWLEERGCRPVSVTRWRRKRANSSMGYDPGDFVPLHEWCLDHSEMPSAAFGMAGCSTKWKAQPIDAKVAELRELADSLGRPLVRLFGFGADDAHRHKDFDPGGNVCRSPLIEWDWGREECRSAITAAGLPLPGKSSCFMCPHMKLPEIGMLRRDSPELFATALEIERRWLDEGRRQPSLTDLEIAQRKTWARVTMDDLRGSVAGLGRSKAWGDYTSDELDAAAEQDDDDNPRPCGCMDG